MTRRLFLFLLRGFGTGYVPRMPGTMGSLLGFFLVLPFCVQGGRIGPGPSTYVLTGLCIATALLAWIGFRVFQEEWEAFDPSDIVLDEFAGTFLMMALVSLMGGGNRYLLGFVLFRLFDVMKPAPIRHAERAGRFVGLVFDDLLAAFMAAGGTGLIYVVFNGVV